MDYRFCQGRFIIWASRDPCRLATELVLAGRGPSANGAPLNLRMSRWPRVRFRLPSSTSPRNTHPGAASGVLVAASTAWHLQIGVNLGDMIGKQQILTPSPKRVVSCHHLSMSRSIGVGAGSRATCYLLRC